MTNTLYKKKILDYILTYKFSQDHLEIFFSSIRAMGGFNNNPTATQFSAAYKKLLIHNEVKSSADANCLILDETTILTASSKKAPSEEIYDDQNEIIEDFDFDESPLDILDSSIPEIVKYVAGFVESRLIKSINCNQCLESLNKCEADQSNFITLKSKGGLRFPRRDTTKVCETVHKIINLIKSENKILNKNIFQIITINSLNKLDLNNLFREFDQHILDCDIMDNHKYIFIKKIIEFYVKINLFHIAKTKSLNQHKQYIRHSLSKKIHFLGQ